MRRHPEPFFHEDRYLGGPKGHQHDRHEGEHGHANPKADKDQGTADKFEATHKGSQKIRKGEPNGLEATCASNAWEEELLDPL